MAKIEQIASEESRIPIDELFINSINSAELIEI